MTSHDHACAFVFAEVANVSRELMVVQFVSILFALLVGVKGKCAVKIFVKGTIFR